MKINIEFAGPDWHFARIEQNYNEVEKRKEANWTIMKPLHYFHFLCICLSKLFHIQANVHTETLVTLNLGVNGKNR